MCSEQTSNDNIGQRVSFLYSAWSALLDESMKGEGELPQGADQGVHYLMRFQTQYTCNLPNAERHLTFGREAAKLVLATPAKE
ncbi:hypothetical protein RHSIM_Rhsim09G0136300 [Rhododendron simsii]|uniref:Uncharacterized protein n=1 Tax=Rhododendron simsii TaxID=118357 RepID=A0A834GLH9_RHOSS|nr:hypothetical protein RHSIM_Rhsim09G0136300 [Rhododendron simsii]